MIVAESLSRAKRDLLARMLRGEDTATIEIAPRAPDHQAPLSAEQEHVWLHEAMHPGGGLYNESITIHRRGPCDPAILRASVSEIIRRHEIWRTGFETGSSGVTQRVHRDIVVSFPLSDLSHLAGPARERGFRRIATREARIPFDPARPPLLRGHLVRFGPTEHRLCLTLHHLIFDGVSIYRILMPSLAAIYAACAAGCDPAGSDVGIFPTVQYGDYAVWREAQCGSQQVQRQARHWRTALAGDMPVLPLAAAATRSGVPARRAGMKIFTLSADVTRRVKRLARDLGVTVYAMLLSVFQCLLFRWTAQRDIVVGGVTDMRRHLALESTIGYFLNSLPLRTHPDPETSFAAYARQTAAMVIDALDACDVPFTRIVRDLRPSRAEGVHPLFQVLFSMEPTAPAFAEGWDLTQMDVTPAAAKFDLYLELDERPQGLVGRLLYRADLFTPAMAGRMVGQWCRLLDGVLEDPSRTLGELDPLTPRELAGLRSRHGPRRPLSPEPVHVLIAAWAERSPDGVAVRCDGDHCTYRELDRAANRVAHDLRAAGVVPGAIVALCVERGIGMVVALLGILKTGAAYLPLDAVLPAARLAHYVGEARPFAVLASPHLRDLLPASGATIVTLAEPAAQDADIAAFAHEGRDDAAAYVLFTSGSTGPPKAVEVTHRALVNLLTAMRDDLSFSQSDVLLAVTTIAFDIAALELFLPLLAGGTVIIASRETVRDPARVIALIDACRPTILQATPTFWRGLIDAGWSGQDGMTALCGGEMLPRDLVSDLLARVGAVWNLYGPTETTIWSTRHRVEPGTGPVPIGRPVANTTVFVLDAQGHLAPDGAIGELYIGGEGLAVGYLHRPDRTRERFVVRPGSGAARVYRTGDLVRFRSDGALEWLGRVDEEIKIRGHRVAIDEIEERLHAHPDIAMAAVARGARGELVAHVVPRGVPPSVGALRDHLGQVLPDYMVPTSYVFPGTLPRSATGKLDRAALRNVAGEGIHGGTREPCGATETVLADLFRDSLSVTRLGADDSFFDLGGHSLLAARLIGRIRARFGVGVPLATIFRYPTVTSLARFLDKQPDPRGTENSSAARRLMLRFESLGEDCEFGFVQRRHGAEPFGLLRFAGIDVESLVGALDDGFEAIGDIGQLRMERRADSVVLHTDRYRCSHILPLGAATDSQVTLAAEAAKLRVLRSMLLRTLRKGHRVCVVKAHEGLRDAQIARLREALRRHGPARLLWVRERHGEVEPGHVEIRSDGVLVGWIDRFAPPDAPEGASPLWLTICREVQHLIRARGAAA